MGLRREVTNLGLLPCVPGGKVEGFLPFFRARIVIQRGAFELIHETVGHFGGEMGRRAK